MIVSKAKDSLSVFTPGLRVLVTAGASGIGRAVADTLIRHGAHVAVCDIDENALADFRNNYPDHLAVLADVSKELDVDQLFEQLTEKLGGIDALVNNAGIAGPTGGTEEKPVGTVWVAIASKEKTEAITTPI
jgi:NAD(P)-dependent dehydrogenase (short-subunit alcohol dehydrogenase family)